MTNFSSTPKTKLTIHQLDVLMTIVSGNSGDPAHPLVDIYQLLDRVKKKVILQSMQTTLRALILYGMVEKRPREIRAGRSLMVYEATKLGVLIGGGATPVYSFVGGEDEETVSD